MGRLKGRFLDTYALIEYLRGNPGYKDRIEEGGITSILNLMELYYKTLVEHGEELAEKAYLTFRVFRLEFEDDDVRKAMKLRLALRSRGRAVSYTDAVGYYLSLKYQIRFLTGDRAFRELDNVEFVR